jgi:basic membrane protein A
MRRWCWLGLAVVVAGCSGGSGSASSGTPGSTSTGSGVPIGLVSDVGGIGDLSFNMMAWDGLQRAEKELGIKKNLVESQQPTDYAPNLQRMAEKGCKVVFAVGYALADAANEVAPKYPNTHFVIIDSDQAKAPNVTGLVFREQEGSFLVGALAGGMSKSKTLGFVGGQEIPLIKRFEAGYRAGIRTTKPDAEVVAKYTNNWEDVAKGKELALSLYEQGSDIVFHASGRCGLGVIEAAKSKGPGFWAIGVDADQDYLGTADPKNPAPPSRVLTSMMKRVDNAVFTICQDAVKGEVKGGVRSLGVKEGGVDISPLKYTKGDIPPALLTTIDKLRKGIADGKIVPPRTLEELSSYHPVTPR